MRVDNGGWEIGGWVDGFPLFRLCMFGVRFWVTSEIVAN